MSPDKKSASSANKSISISGDVKDSAVIIGDNNTVNQTIIQKFFNIFKNDAETLEQRNRRILLGHVENAWIKGVLDASLHGAALLDLGIKQDPEAVTKYPWTIKKEATDETLPTGTSMLEIFDSIGMGRSLLILGAPGSGKTTMLLELARQLIQHAREDVTYPIPMVFNLASWTEKLTLADWLAQELNNLYSVPGKTAPDWVKGNKLLLLLDGLDEVRQESRAKCVEAINVFRKEHGLTSLAVCSRSQDYADLTAKLSFEGAIEVQPLTQKQITEFFNRFGKEMAGIKQVLKKDSALREMAETPLFLSIMIMAFRDRLDVDIWVSRDEKAQRKYLFDAYIERMFERRLENTVFKKQDILSWLSWLAKKLIENGVTLYLFEDMQPNLINRKTRTAYGWFALYRLLVGVLVGLIGGLMIGILTALVFGLTQGALTGWVMGINAALDYGSKYSLMFGLIVGIGFMIGGRLHEIKMIDHLAWDWKRAKTGSLIGFIVGLLGGIVIALIRYWIILELIKTFPEMGKGENLSIFGMVEGACIAGLTVGFLGGVFGLAIGGISGKQTEYTLYPGQKISSSTKNFFFVFLWLGLGIWLTFGLVGGMGDPLGMFLFGAYVAPLTGLLIGLLFGGLAIAQHYALRLVLTLKKNLPIQLPPFLDHCVDLIFLRRVGGGYIFVHRLLMEHFAEMYVETTTSKGN